MFFRNYYPTIIKNTKKLELNCPNCFNNTYHQLYEFYTGFCFGFIFLSKPLIANKKYFFVCPVCGNTTKEIPAENIKLFYDSGSTETQDFVKTQNHYCNNCGKKIYSNYIFCKNCGAKLK
jgi:predicted RNA-binding Zn-ribbon protein involved in translation (DUF1610 family)